MQSRSLKSPSRWAIDLSAIMVGALLLGTADAALCEPMGDETLTRRVAMARRMQAETQEALKVIKPR